MPDAVPIEVAATPGAVPFDASSMVPAEIQTEPYFANFKGKTVGDVMKSAVEAQKLIGGSVRIPAADAKDEDWNAYYGKLRPESPERYTAKFKDEGLAQTNEEFLKSITRGMWDAGLHQRQVEKIIGAYEDAYVAEQTNIKNQIEFGVIEGTNILKEKYKGDFEQAAIMANRAAKRFGGDAFVQLIKDYHLSADPTFFNTFYNIAQAIHEDTWAGGETPKFLTREEASRQTSSILADREHPYHKTSHPQHAAAVAQMDALRKVQYQPREVSE